MTREKSTRDDAQTEVPSPSSHPQRIPAGPPTGQSKPSNGAQSDYKGTAGRSVSSDSDSPTPSSHTLKPETEDAIGPGSSVAVAGTGDTEGGGCVSGNGGGGGTANANCRTEEKDDVPASFASITGGRCIASVFAGHGELKSVLGTVVKFATGISPDTGDTVLTLVLALLVNPSHFLLLLLLDTCSRSLRCTAERDFPRNRESEVPRLHFFEG